VNTAPGNDEIVDVPERIPALLKDRNADACRGRACRSDGERDPRAVVREQRGPTAGRRLVRGRMAARRASVEAEDGA
jgi:hypothetical protein